MTIPSAHQSSEFLHRCKINSVGTLWRSAFRIVLGKKTHLYMVLELFGIILLLQIIISLMHTYSENLRFLIEFHYFVEKVTVSVVEIFLYLLCYKLIK